jgi:spermidine synthase
VNRDFYPYMFIKQISHWLSYFGTNYKILVLIPLLLFLLGFLRLNTITAGLYTGGFTAGSLEVLLLLAYQVWFGSIYLATAFFFAIFMAGLAFGSSGYLRFNKPLIQRYYLLQFALAGFAVALPLLIKLTGEISYWRLPSQLLFFILIFTLAAGIGQEFLTASKLSQSVYSESSGISYSTDLAGSAFGAFLTAIVLLPLTGITITCLVVAGLNILSGSLAFSVRKTF